MDRSTAITSYCTAWFGLAARSYAVGRGMLKLDKLIAMQFAKGDMPQLLDNMIIEGTLVVEPAAFALVGPVKRVFRQIMFVEFGNGCCIEPFTYLLFMGKSPVATLPSSSRALMRAASIPATRSNHQKFA